MTDNNNVIYNNKFIELIDILNEFNDLIDTKTNLKKNNYFDDLIIFTDKFDNINKLAFEFENLFLNNSNNPNDLNNQKIFNYVFEKEFERGNIEYKRSLVSYNDNEKENKLVRQIFWRIYEGVVNVNMECCYYIIGIEDSGFPSFLSIDELMNSIDFISKCIENAELNYSYLFLKNSIMNYDYAIVKFWPINSNQIDFF